MSSNRRLPVYVLIDSSGSMRGEPVLSVNVGIQAMLNTLRQDPYALESVHLTIITFDNEARVVLPMTPISDVQFSGVTIDGPGATFTGAALELLVQCLKRDVKHTSENVKGDWRPLVFLMTDGTPSDMYAYEQIIPQVKALNLASIIACAAGPKAKTAHLSLLTSHVVALDTMDEASFSSFFKWVSASVGLGSMSAGVTGSVELPPPPPEVQLVL